MDNTFAPVPFAFVGLNTNDWDIPEAEKYPVCPIFVIVSLFNESISVESFIEISHAPARILFSGFTLLNNIGLLLEIPYCANIGLLLLLIIYTNYIYYNPNANTTYISKKTDLIRHGPHLL